jgi:hypothetical protein
MGIGDEQPLLGTVAVCGSHEDGWPASAVEDRLDLDGGAGTSSLELSDHADADKSLTVVRDVDRGA